MPTLLHDREPVSRGAVRCDVCGRTIRKGETYLRQTLKYDDTPYDFRMCPHCRAFDRIVNLWELCGAPDEGYDSDSVRDLIADGWINDRGREAMVQGNRFLRGWTNRRTGDLYPEWSKE